MNLLTEHRDLLDAIANRLIEKEKMDGTEMLELIQSIKPQLVTEEAMNTVKELVSKTTEAMVDAAEKVADLGDGGDSPTPATA